MNAIEIHELTRDYGGGRGVFDVSITIKTGEAFGFLGPNGADKTTTIRHLMGFLRPQSGTCLINGLDCWQESAAIQSNLGYIPSEISFLMVFWEMSFWALSPSIGTSTLPIAEAKS